MTAEELQRVLNKRRGAMLSRRSILKGYAPVAAPVRRSCVEGVPDMRQARGQPVYTVAASAPVQGLRNLLSHVRLCPGQCSTTATGVAAVCLLLKS